MSKPNPADYRPCVGTMLVNEEGRVFVGQRFDSTEGDAWQMPQGGVDPGEDFGEAMWRELHEETGVGPEHGEVVGTLGEEVYYDLPDDLKGKLWGGKYVGQRQTWFLVRFTGSDADINLEAHKHPEFSAYQWVDPEALPDLIVSFKRDVYRRILDGFRDRI